MPSPQTQARTAGLLYLASGLPGVYSYIYMPTALIVPGDATATAGRIANAALTYRLGILGDVAGQTLLVVLALTLYGLLEHAGRTYARLMVALAAIGATVQIANVFNLVAPLVLWSRAGYLSAFNTAQLDALALGFLTARATGLFISQIFWGLWLLPFGMLVMRSRMFPRILGVLLILACVGYVAASTAFLAVPEHAHLLIHLSSIVGGVGEGAIILWLLVVGAKAPVRVVGAVPSAGETG
jgi:hypothetical protein